MVGGALRRRPGRGGQQLAPDLAVGRDGKAGQFAERAGDLPAGRRGRIQIELQVEPQAAAGLQGKQQFGRQTGDAVEGTVEGELGFAEDQGAREGAGLADLHTPTATEIVRLRRRRQQARVATRQLEAVVAAQVGVVDLDDQHHRRRAAGRRVG